MATRTSYLVSAKRHRVISKNLEEPSPTENEEEIDDQIRSMDSHARHCEKKYWSDLRADTGTLFFPGKIVMEQHNLTHFPSQSLSKETECSGFEETVGDSTNEQHSAKMPEMWIANTNPGRRSTVMELASATPLNESKFCGEQTTVRTSSLNTMGTKGKHKSADDNKIAPRLSQERRSWELDVGEWEPAANSTTNKCWSE